MPRRLAPAAQRHRLERRTRREAPDEQLGAFAFVTAIAVAVEGHGRSPQPPVGVGPHEAGRAAHRGERFRR